MIGRNKNLLEKSLDVYNQIKTHSPTHSNHHETNKQPKAKQHHTKVMIK